MSTKNMIMAALADGAPRTCPQIAMIIGKTSKSLAAHMSELSRRGVLYRVDGIRNQRQNYYAINSFTVADLPPLQPEVPTGMRKCRQCGEIKPADTVHFHAYARSSGQEPRLKTVCRSCVSHNQTAYRAANAAALAARKAALKQARTTKPTAGGIITRERYGDSTRVTFTDTWRPFRDSGKSMAGFTGYSSPLTRIDF